MSEVITNKYLSLDGLRKYDGLIKGFVASGNKELADAITALSNKIGSLEFDGSDNKSVSEIIEGIYASIADIVEKQGLLEGKDVELEGRINGIIGDLESLEDSVSLMSLVEVANKLKAIDASVAKNAQDIVGVTERVTAVEEAIKNLGEIEGGESLGEIVSEVKLNTAAIDTLKGEGEGSVKKAAADALADAKAYADGLAGNYDAAGAADAALAEAKTYTDSKVDGKFDVAGAADAAKDAAIADAAEKYQVKGDYESAGAAAQALADAKADAAEKYQVKGDYEVAGAAATALNDAKAYADSLAANYDASGSASKALEDAQAYVDGKVDGKFDEAGAAAQALADAKADAASLYQVKGDYEVAGTAAGLNAAMDERVVKLEAIDHEKLAADASAAAVAAIVAGAESDFDTLKEVEEWIGAHKEGAAELQTTVSGHTDSINTLTADLSTLDSKVDQDIANLTDHMSAAATALEEVDGRLDVLEVFVESHDVITDDDINALFA